jgi:CHAD domain-containing protein
VSDEPGTSADVAAEAAQAAEAAGADETAPGPDGQHAEIELKYDVTDRAALQALLDAPEIAGLGGGRWRESIVEDRYLDTADRALGQSGYAARLRVGGGRTILGLKALTPARGPLHRRREIEGPAGDGLDPAAWPASEARDMLVQAVGGQPLEELCRIRQRRRVRVVRGAGGEVELSLDEVEVFRGGRRLGAFPVFEAELRTGDESVLEGIAAAIDATGSTHASDRSKFEVAMDLVAAAPRKGAAAAPAEAEAGPSRPVLEVGKSPGVATDDTFAEAGRKVIRFHLARMLATEAGARSGERAEDLHKMRVATRRMRAAWRVFGDAFRPGRVRRSVGALRTLAAHLGAVRDLDVLLDELAAYGETLDPEGQSALSPLQDAWRSERETARAELVRYLDSRAYRRFVDDQVAFVGTPGQDAIPAGPTEPRRVRDTAPSRLWAAYETVRAYDGVLRWADLATLHELRIAGKRLRYAVEFVREPLGPDAGMLIERITGLQDHLGMLHDADVAAGLARAFLVHEAATLPSTSVNAIGGYLGSREREMARLRRTIGPPWRRITSIEFRRAMGRGAAQL